METGWARENAYITGLPHAHTDIEVRQHTTHGCLQA